MNWKKCSFGQPSIRYLGHIIGQEGVKADPEKLCVMKEWPLPRNPKS